MKLRHVTPVVVAFILATFAPHPSAAQLTGPSHINAIRASFAAEPSYRVALNDRTLHLADARSGAEVCTISESELGTLTMRSFVATDALRIDRSQLDATIQQYNDNAVMGTLWRVAEGKGVEILYHLNGRMITSAMAVDLAQQFGREVRGEMMQISRQ